MRSLASDICGVGGGMWDICVVGGLSLQKSGKWSDSNVFSETVVLQWSELEFERM